MGLRCAGQTTRLAKPIRDSCVRPEADLALPGPWALGVCAVCIVTVSSDHRACRGYHEANLGHGNGLFVLVSGFVGRFPISDTVLRAQEAWGALEGAPGDRTRREVVSMGPFPRRCPTARFAAWCHGASVVNRLNTPPLRAMSNRERAPKPKVVGEVPRLRSARSQ